MSGYGKLRRCTEKRRVIAKLYPMPAVINMVRGNRESIRTVLASLVASQQAGQWSRYDRNFWAPLVRTLHDHLET